MNQCVHFLTCKLAAVCLLLALTGTLSAQQPAQPPFGEGTHALRAIMKEKFRLAPLTLEEFAEQFKQPENIVLVVLGNTDFLERLHPSGAALRAFVERGGALLVATDSRSAPALRQAFGVEVPGYFVHVPPDSQSAYRRLGDCPLVNDFTRENSPLFRNVQQIATNRPSYLDFKALNRPRPERLAWFPRDATTQNQSQFTPTNCPFAAGQEIGRGRVLVLADHSIFINDMMLQNDNDNFEFACNCVEWLTESGKRKQVILVEEGQVNTDFNVSFQDPPLPPLPSQEDIVAKLNQVLLGLEQENFFNRTLARLVPQDHLLRILLLVLTLGLGIFGLVRLLQASYRDPRPPPLPENKPVPAWADNVILRRQQATLKDNNLWETGRDLARTALQPIHTPRPGAAVTWTGAGNSAPSIEVRGSWWQRRTLRCQVSRLWQLACGHRPERISARRFRRLVAEMKLVEAALGDGRLRLSAVRSQESGVKNQAPGTSRLLASES